MIRVMTVVGARPQFIKAAALSKAFREIGQAQLQEIIVHTGQHFDSNMSTVFFEELGIPEPKVLLSPPVGGHGAGTAQMLSGLAYEVERLAPDLVVVFGDTNSTLAGALAAVKQHVPVAHVEAGLRSGNKAMPEEINRIVTDHVSAMNFAPSTRAFDQLVLEGLESSAFFVGDIMFDCVRLFSGITGRTSKLDFLPRKFALLTLHRQENTDSPARLRKMIEQVFDFSSSMEVVLPMHPRLRLSLEMVGLLEAVTKKLRVVEPQSFLSMLQIQKRATIVLTDSGGLQKEAFYLNIPCVTLRSETEWPETVALGRNVLFDPESERLSEVAFEALNSRAKSGEPYGDSFAAQKIVTKIMAGGWDNFFVGSN